MNGETGTFRDPEGSCFERDGRILRRVFPEFRDRALALLNSQFLKQMIAAGNFPKTWIHADAGIDSPGVANLQNDGLILEHEAVFFPSYSHEWSPRMLYRAGELTLKLQLEALAIGLTLKDATPSNVLFRGAQPVFVDFLSFVKSPKGSSIWLAYAQFVRTFLLPLLLNKHTQTPLTEIFMAYRDGLEPEGIFHRFSRMARFRPRVFTYVTLPTWLGRRPAAHQLKSGQPVGNEDEERCSFILTSLVKQLQGSFRNLGPNASPGSKWSGYMESHSYSSEAFGAKEAFVKATLEEAKPRTVLDIGCNTGYWSQLAARTGSSVVALDSDPVVIDHLYVQSVAEHLDILPLVLNFARPTPALGWRNSEQESFMKRARGKFDCVMMLAVIHHLTVTEGLPLEQVFQAVHEITRRDLIIEYVPPEDPMFQALVRNKEHLIPSLSRENFERCFQEYFTKSRMLQLPDNPRFIYHLRKLDVS